MSCGAGFAAATGGHHGVVVEESNMDMSKHPH